MRRNDFFKYLIFGGGGSASRSELESETLPYTFVSKSQRLKDYRIYGNTVDGESVGDLVETGEHTGEYLVPMTVNDTTTDLYLPEPLKMVGGKAEYVDFREQKQHRVRKNLLLNTAASQTIDGVTFTVNSDRSVTCNGTANNVILYEIYSFPRFSGECILSGCPMGGSQNTYRLQYTNLRNLSYKDYGTGVNIYQFDEIQYPTSKINIRIEKGYTCNNLTFYPMIRKADITDDAYEPYIENTEIDVTLPALPILEGTNTLSIGTTVQPSKIWIQGNVSEIPPVSASLNSIPQSLRMIDLSKDKVSEPENEDLQLDIVPVEKYVINLKDSEKTIEPTKVERGVESAE